MGKVVSGIGKAAGGVGRAVGGLASTALGFVGDPLGYGANQDAISAQRDATAQANATLERIYSQQRQDLEPWRQAGLGALSDLANPDFKKDFDQEFKPPNMQDDPGYQFRLNEGLKALERSAAARGGLQSGGTLKAIARYGQDYASNEYQNAYNRAYTQYNDAYSRFNADRDRRFNRLSSLANIGYGATEQGVNAGSSFGTALSGNQTALGNAIGAAHLARGQANQSVVGGLFSLGTGLVGGKK